MKKLFISLLLIKTIQATPENDLHNEYIRFVEFEATDVKGHIPRLMRLAKHCDSVVEIGIRDIVSTWGILEGLAHNKKNVKKYIGIDLVFPPESNFHKLKTLARGVAIDFKFIAQNDMDIDPIDADMLFIDSLHTYCHLTYELEKFSPHIKKYIAMHDTSEPWGTLDDNQYTGDYSEYPAWYDRSKKGLWAAVEDFLARHPEWTLHKRYYDFHGLTVLRRK